MQFCHKKESYVHSLQKEPVLSSQSWEGLNFFWPVTDFLYVSDFFSAFFEKSRQKRVPTFFYICVFKYLWSKKHKNFQKNVGTQSVLS